MSEITGLVTPTYITFTDRNGREWEALALLAPLRSPDMEPVQLAMTEDLDLRVKKIKLVKRDAVSG